MFSKRIISMLVVLSFISQALVVVDTDSYSSAVVEDSSILEELYGENGARSRTVENATLLKDIVSGGSSSNPQSLFAHTDGNLYFSQGGYNCYRSDGTEEGTVPFSGGHCTYFASLGDTLLFAKEHDTYGWELHSYDGSSEPVIVKNINEDDSGVEMAFLMNSGIIQLFGQFQSTMNSFYLELKTNPVMLNCGELMELQMELIV